MTVASGRMGRLQEDAHSTGFDYAEGSPHIKHHAIRAPLVEQLHRAVGAIVDARGSCTALEVGAGHGTFTDHLVAAGATVEVTEMSGPSAAALRARFRNTPTVRVVHDVDGSASTGGPPVDLLVCVSVLHHIPDYLGAVAAMTDRIRPGGSFLSFQDPMYYPRRSRVARAVERAAYLTWRLPQGEFRRGLSRSVRMWRGVYDETNPSDMVEYHIVRDGMDEQALVDLLRTRFGSVELSTYWAAQAPWAQAAGARLMRPNTFSLTASRRRS